MLRAASPRQSAVFAAALAAWLQCCAAVEWRISNALPVTGKFRVAELEFYSDAECSKRVAVKKRSAYIRPLPKSTDFQPVLQHQGEDCWGACQNKAGPCEFCGRGGACCKEGSVKDPMECQQAVGFMREYHECVAVDNGMGSPAWQAFDDDLETSLEVTCTESSCTKGSLVLGAELANPNAVVGCVVLMQPSLHLSTNGLASVPKVPQMLASRSATRDSECPAICRSGKFVDRYGIGHACIMHLSPAGACSPTPGGGTNCSACRDLPAPKWEYDALALSDTKLRFGGAFVATRLRVEPPVRKVEGLVNSQAARDKVAYVASRMSDRNARAGHAQALHRGQDCWVACGAVAGTCSWCGARGACCKKGLDSDPDECNGATGFMTGHHECVVIAPPKLEVQLRNWFMNDATLCLMGFLGLVFAGFLGAAGAALFNKLHRKVQEQTSTTFDKGVSPPVAEGTELEGAMQGASKEWNNN